VEDARQALIPAWSTTHLSFGPSTFTLAFTNAAGLLDVLQIGEAQAVILHGVLARVLQAVLRDGGTHLLALIG
jgi:hypothetical protein